MDLAFRQLSRKWDAGDESVAVPLLRHYLANRLQGAEHQTKMPPIEVTSVDRNFTVIKIPGCYEILVSFSTAVAFSEEFQGGAYRICRTSVYYSASTNRHIRRWLDGRDCIEVEQSEVDETLRLGYTGPMHGNV